MLNWIRQLDRVLRGETTRMTELRREGLNVPIVGLSVVIDILGIIYGACMGSFAVTGSGSGKYMQIPASMLKVPALFLLTLLVTLPSLYVFNALVGSRVRFVATVRLLVSSIAVMLAVLSSAGPIVAFFSLCTTSYPFMILLNVLVFGIAGCLGLGFMLQTLHRLSLIQELEESVLIQAALPAEGAAAIAASPPPPAIYLDQAERPTPSKSVKAVFRIWLIVFALVGAQMGWVLRPFLGAPNQPFAWFRPKESNFFDAVYIHARLLAGWDDLWRRR